MGSKVLVLAVWKQFSFPQVKLLPHDLCFLFLFFWRCFMSFKEILVKLSATSGENTPKIIKSSGETVLNNSGPSAECLYKYFFKSTT